MTVRVALAGVTGWAGADLARGVAAAPDLALVAGTSRTHAGRTIAEALGAPGASGLGAPVVATVPEALAVGVDVLVEFTHPSVARANVEAAIRAGAHCVVGTSGLTDDDYAALDAPARAAGVGVLACGNFALTAVLLQDLQRKRGRVDFPPH